MGFPVPLHIWINHNFSDYAKSLLLSKDSLIKPLINTKNVMNMLESDVQMRHHANGMKLWMLMNLEIWMKHYF